MKKLLFLQLLYLTSMIAYAQKEVYSLNNLKILIQDSIVYKDVLLGNINIPAIESGLASRQNYNGNAIKYPIKIALDPGHSAFSFKEAVMEERFIQRASEKGKKGDIKFYESELTMATAYLVKEMLERHGFHVMLTRENYMTSFDMTYSQWYKRSRRQQLENDYLQGKITKDQFETYSQLGMKDLFIQYFNIVDLENRKKKVNLFNPDLTIIIHFNASEFQASEHIDAPIVGHNYSVSFIPGGFTNYELVSLTQAEDLRRLTSTDDIEKSLNLSNSILKQFELAFGVAPINPISHEVPWANKFSTSSEFQGIFGRNLFLTRTIQSPLAYMEPFLQNNQDFIYKLNERTMVVNGRKVSPLLQTVARCYFNGVLDYLRNGKFSIEF
ncbi:MAG: N-acetylmuramoyl-L-alanine amidase [Cyclobacteriaceae bacterium]